MKLSSFSLALTVLVSVSPEACAFTAVPSVAFSSRSSARPLFGILDEINSDAYDLLGGGSDDGAVSKEMEAAYEAFLAELVFSPNDPKMDIIENFERCSDDEWLGWLDTKVNSSVDPEERMALRQLWELINQVKKQMELSEMAKQRVAREAEEAEAKRIATAEAEAAAGGSMSNTDVLRKAAAVDKAGVASAIAEDGDIKKKTFYETELTPEIRLSYEDMVKKVLPPYKPGDTVQSIVFTNYDQFDAQFVKVLTERASNGDGDSNVVLEALAEEQQKKIGAATEVLRQVLTLGDPMRMEGAIVKMAREGKIDEPFLLLLEVNADQAMAAGARGPAELMKKLRKRASEEKDKQSSSKEVKLLRKLLRAESSDERETLLEEAFTPKESLIVPGTAANAAAAMEGDIPEEEKPLPDVPPPDFINACKAVMLNFGNLAYDDENGDLAGRIKQIASEAEVVATRIYGKGMTQREQQDRAWKETTTSIFDLETLEIEAERMGQDAPWTNKDGGDDLLPGFNADGKMRIGGQ